MKKTCLALLSLVFVGAASAEDLLAPEEHPSIWCSIDFVSPLQIMPPNATVELFRFNILFGENHGVHGLDVGLVGASRAASWGLQLNTLAGWNDLDFDGVQVSGIGDVVLGNGAGIQVAGAVNYVRGGYTGFQLAPLNWDGGFYGMEVGGLNINKGISYGFQIGGYNANLNEFHGWSFGAINCTERMEGFQLGVLNIIPQKGRGVQLGVLNAAENFRGVQIGVLNLIGNGELPIMPVLNANF